MITPEEFYVGYLPTPPGLMRRLRRRALTILFVAGPIGALISAAHTPSAGGSFAYGHPEMVTGTIDAAPLPAIRVSEGGTVRRIPLVALGKHGVRDAAAWNGRGVRVQVTRIDRGADRMYEVAAPPEIDTTVTPAAAPTWAMAGHVTLRGEVVDGKCDLGVMNPGDGPLHRACAVRCLHGGVPPMLLMRDTAGAELRVALSGETAPLPGDFVAQWAGAVVEVTGTLVQSEGASLLLVTPDAIRRLP